MKRDTSVLLGVKGLIILEAYKRQVTVLNHNIYIYIYVSLLKMHTLFFKIISESSSQNASVYWSTPTSYQMSRHYMQFAYLIPAITRLVMLLRNPIAIHLSATIVKQKQTGNCGRGIRNEHMSNTNIKCYGTNSIYKENSTYIYGNLASWMMV